jgi:hypothetical protein
MITSTPEKEHICASLYDMPAEMAHNYEKYGQTSQVITQRNIKKSRIDVFFSRKEQKKEEYN